MLLDYKTRSEAKQLLKNYKLTDFEALSLALQAKQIAVMEQIINSK